MNAPARPYDSVRIKLLRLKQEVEECLAELDAGAANGGPDAPEPMYMTVKAYALRMSVGERTVERWVRLGLPHERRGRMVRIDVAGAAKWKKPASIVAAADAEARKGGE